MDRHGGKGNYMEKEKHTHVKRNIADMILRAGFPPAHLAEINFEAYYQDRIQQQKAQNQKTETQTDASAVQH